MTDPLDIEGVDTEDPFCPSGNGLGPHHYQPVIDIFGGTGIHLFCTQCGDHFQMDGTAPAPGQSAPTMMPQQSNGTGTSTAPGWPFNP